ncbi:MAG TPA: hypothetical protein VMF61_06525 [Candidatus Acidoferrales bacterium]|nr:hypothetical protein [Candidatus Acidoferrales bacterium]
MQRTIHEKAELVDFLKAVEDRRVVVFGEVTRDPAADVGTLAVTVRIRDPQRRRDFADRPPLDALHRDDRVLAQRSLVFTGGEVGISATLGALTDELVNANEDRAFAIPSASLNAGVLEKPSNQRILSQGARIVQVAE